MKFRVAGATLLAALLAWQPAASQVNEKFADMTAEIELLRSVAQTERQAIVAKAMPLTDQESAVFWPLYAEYRAAVARINDQLVKLITDYAAQRDTLTDAQADALLADYFAYERDLLNLRKKYVKRFAEALPMIKATRFYQIDNKLDSLRWLGLAREIPLAR